MAAQIDQRDLDLQDQLAHIRKTQAEINRMFNEHAKFQVQTKVIPISSILQAYIAAAALMGVGAAISKLFFP